MKSGSESMPFGKRQAWEVFVLAAMAFFPRLILALRTDVVSGDGVGYLRAAVGEVDGGASFRLPLYPALIRWFSPWAASPQAAGQAISVVCGSLLAVVVWAWGRRVHPSLGFPLGILAAALPYHMRYSADVLTEPLYLLLVSLFFLLGFGGGGEGTQSKRRAFGLAIGLGALAGLLGLTRPEGIAVASLGMIGFAIERRRQVAVLVVALGLFGSLSTIHLLDLSRSSATAATLRRNYVEHLLESESEEGRTPSLAEIGEFDWSELSWGRAVRKTVLGTGEAVWMFGEALFPLTLGLAVWGGLWVWSGRRSIRIEWKRIWTPLFGALALFCFFCGLHPSRRLLLQCAIPALLFAGIGSRSIAARWGEGTSRGLLFLVYLMSWGKAGWSQREDKLWMREVGGRVAELSAPHSPVVITTSPRVAYYAGGRRIDPHAPREEQPGNRSFEAGIREALEEEKPVFRLLLPGEDLGVEESEALPSEVRTVRVGPEGFGVFEKEERP